MDQQDVTPHTEISQDGWNITSATPEAALRQELATEAPEAPITEHPPDPPAAAAPPAAPATPEAPAPRPGSPEGRVALLRAEINQLTRDKHAEKAQKALIDAEIAEKRAERDAIQREINTARSRRPDTDPDAEPETAPAPPAQTATSRTPEPEEDDFPDFRDWVKAHAVWTREQAALDAGDVLARREQQAQQAAQQQQAQAYQHDLATKHTQRLEAYAAANPGFLELMQKGADLPTNDAIQVHVLHSETGPAIMRYLVENPAECERLAALGPGPTFVELGKIEARLAPAKSGSGTGRQSVTKAEPPINPVGTSATAADAESDDDLATMEFSPEYVRKMNARDRKRDHARRL